MSLPLPPVSARPMPDMIDFLACRRSSKIALLAAPGPDESDIDLILRLAARVPDHGKLAPWRFIVIRGDARARAGRLLRDIWMAGNPGTPDAKLDLESERFMRAPTIVAVVASPKDAKIPEWEQTLSAGAACFNLCLAANARGFATNWVTEWYAYDPDFAAAMGLGPRERFAGFIYIGTATATPEERERPQMSDLVTVFR